MFGQQERVYRVTGMRITKATPACGAYVTGVDLSRPVSDALLEEIKGALHRHGVLFFRDQTITPAQQVAFGRRFGPLHIHPYAANLGPEFPEILPLDETARDTVHWHCDSTYEEYPPLGAILHAQHIPSNGGDTIWASMCAAYDALSPTMQTILAGLRAVHGGEKIAKFMHRNPRNRDKPLISATHPVIITDPVTKRKAIFVNEDYTSHIEGLNAPESEALLQMLHRHTQKPEFQVRLRWEPQTLAFWCNPIVQHYPVPDYTEPRLMHRVTVLLEERIA